jgi:ADP-ribosylglycohydrolase
LHASYASAPAPPDPGRFELPPFGPDLQLAYDRAYGAILGAALGDALGLQTEGDDPHTVADRHPDGPGYPYKGAYKGHAPNDVTDATNTTVLVMRALAAYFTGKTDDPAADFAARLVRWHKDGFAELGDTKGLGLDGVALRAMAQPGFARDPAAAAREVKGPKAENGALIRTAPCAFTAAPAEWALLFCTATHADERCAAAARALALLLGLLARTPADEAVSAELVVGPVAAGRALLTQARSADYMNRLTRSKRLDELGLGDREHRSYVLKTLAVAMWAFRQLARATPAERGPGLFVAAVRAVASQGGDASANCAVAGAVLGAALGHKKLPAEWLGALPNRDWLLQEIASFLVAAGPTWVAGAAAGV